MRPHVADPIPMRARRLWHSAKARAEKRGIPFTLPLDFVVRRLERGSCEATGLAFDLRPARRRTTLPFTPTLDRRHGSEGYTETNTRVVCAAYNVARAGWGDDVIFLVAEGRAAMIRKEPA